MNKRIEIFGKKYRIGKNMSDLTIDQLYEGMMIFGEDTIWRIDALKNCGNNNEKVAYYSILSSDRNGIEDWLGNTAETFIDSSYQHLIGDHEEL